MMKALVLDNGGALSVRSVPEPAMVDGGVCIRLHAAALNSRDQWIRDGLYAKIELPAILGSDGCGVAEAAPFTPSLLGKRVIVDPSLNWGTDPRAQGRQFGVLGMPTQGTLAEKIVVASAQVHEAPEHLSDAEAAALPLSGVTAWRALMVQGACHAGMNVVVTGIGGGVAAMALAFAVGQGAHVWVTSTSDAKVQRAVEMGARGGVNVRQEGWDKALLHQCGHVDLIVDSVGGPTVNDLLNIVRPGGRIVFYGSTLGAGKDVNMHRIFWKQLHLVGSTMGTPTDFADMLRFVADRRIHPVIDTVLPLSRGAEAFDRMRHADHMGKIVISLLEGDA